LQLLFISDNFHGHKNDKERKALVKEGFC